MVNISPIAREQAMAERRMILSYAAPSARDGLAALLALDDTLAGVLRSTRDPMVGQMRLTWWHDAVTRLDTLPAPAEPVLQALAAHVVPHVTGATIAGLVEGWEALLDAQPLTDDRLWAFADGRGARLFEIAGAVLGAGANDPVHRAGRGWALADLAAHVGDGRIGARAAEFASAELREACARRWSPRGRPLGAMAHLARMASDAGPARVARTLWHRLTGG